MVTRRTEGTISSGEGDASKGRGRLNLQHGPEGCEPDEVIEEGSLKVIVTFLLSSGMA